MLAEGTDASTDLANKLSDKRYAQLTDAFGFADGTPATTDKGFMTAFCSSIVNRRSKKLWRCQFILPDRTFCRDATAEHGGKHQQQDKWVLGDLVNCAERVFQTALGLSSSFRALDVDLQVDTCNENRVRCWEAVRSASSLTRPRWGLMKLYLVRTQIAEGVTTTSTAVTLLQNASSGFLSRY